jgi:hypothetical protein
LELNYALSLPEGGEYNGEKESIIWGAQERGYNEHMDQPEPYRILLMTRNLGIPYWSGGLADQPYLLMMEMNAAANGEKRHNAVRAENRTVALLRK